MADNYWPCFFLFNFKSYLLFLAFLFFILLCFFFFRLEPVLESSESELDVEEKEAENEEDEFLAFFFSWAVPLCKFFCLLGDTSSDEELFAGSTSPFSASFVFARLANENFFFFENWNFIRESTVRAGCAADAFDIL